MAKQPDKETTAYNKWATTGFIDGLDVTTGKKVAVLLDAGETYFRAQPDINSTSVNTEQGVVEFNREDILYETIVDIYLKKKNPLLTVNYSDIYVDLKSAISQRGLRMFDADQSINGVPYFDSENLYCFKQWFSNYYANKK